MSSLKNVVKTIFPDSMRRRMKRFLGYTEHHWVRMVLDSETVKLIQGVYQPGMSVLEISGTKWGSSGMFRNYKSVDYPDYDVCSEPLPERFDLIIAEQVFEHLKWPCRAGKNIYQMLNQGGYFLITTPFLLKVHNYPIDCNRWTETGIKYFLAECGFPFESIYSSSWGNRACIKANFKGWVNFNRWLHSLKNEADFPAVVWALCKKGD